MPRLRDADTLWWLAAFVLSSVWCVTAATRLGATFDEPVYLERGLDGWRTGSHGGLLKLGTMPLPADVQTLPLYLAERWRGQPWDMEADFPTLLTMARVANLAFWALLLAYAWRVGASLAGRWGGRLAVAILACEPNMLAHAALATTDIAVSACLLAFLFHFSSGRNESTLRRIVVPGLWYGVALTAKASALAFAPLCMIAVEVSRRPDWRTNWRPFARDVLNIGLLGIGYAVVFCGSDWQPQTSFVLWANGLPASVGKAALVWIAEHLCVFSNAFEGFARQIKHNVRGHGTYLLGTAQDHAFWYYFPVVLSIKLTVPFLMAWGAVLVARRRAVANWIAAATLILLAFSLKCRVQIGIRLLLPCVALAAVALGIAAVRTMAAYKSPSLRFGIAGCVAWMAVASASVWPDGLRYVNELWGGPSGGYHLVSDSNYDWGQGLPELAAWQRQSEVADLHVWYFGTDPRLKDMPFTDEPLHVLPGDTGERLRGQVIAAATSVVYGYGLTPEWRRAAAYLRTRTPVARTGTFLIYDFSDEGASE